MSQTSNNFGVSLNVSWELDVWGRIRSAAAAAVANVQSQRADYAAATLSLAAQTTKSWFAVIESRQQVELAEATVVSYRETARQAKDRVEGGVQSPVDQDLALANLASAEALLQDRRQLLDVALRQLEVLLGRYPTGLLNTEAELPAIPAPVPAGLPAELLRRRPDLVAAERQVAAASQQIVSDQAALLPRISLSASGGSASSELQDILSGDFLIWSLASNLVQPVFEGGRLRARIAVAEGRHKETLEAFAQLALQAFSEVEIALAAEAFLTERERSLEAAATAAESAARVSGNRYVQGVDQLIVVLEGQRRALDAQGALLSVRRQRSDNRVDLHLALGGGFGSLLAMESAAVTVSPDTKSRETR
jgi:NodT family efflux transporter outer membrane factor (OMF) lipoprotein